MTKKLVLPLTPELLSELKPFTLKVAVAISDGYDTIKDLCDYFETSRSAIYRAIDRLVALGILEEETNKARNSRYNARTLKLSAPGLVLDISF